MLAGGEKRTILQSKICYASFLDCLASEEAAGGKSVVLSSTGSARGHRAGCGSRTIETTMTRVPNATDRVTTFWWAYAFDPPISNAGRALVSVLCASNWESATTNLHPANQNHH